MRRRCCLRCRRWPPRRPTGASAPPAPTRPASEARPAAASSTMRACRWQNASRPSSTGAAAPSTGKDYDRAIADYGEAIKLSPKDASAFAHRCEAYESKEDHVAAIADCGHKLAKLKQAYHGGRLWRRGSDATLLHSIAAQKPRISSRPPKSRSMSYRYSCYSS